MENEFKPRILKLDNTHINLERVIALSIYDPKIKEYFYEKSDNDFSDVNKQFDFVDAVFSDRGDLHIELETQHYYVHCAKIAIISFE